MPAQACGETEATAAGCVESYVTPPDGGPGMGPLLRIDSIPKYMCIDIYLVREIPQAEIQSDFRFAELNSSTRMDLNFSMKSGSILGGLSLS